MKFHNFSVSGFGSIWIGEMPSDGSDEDYLRPQYDRADGEPLAPWMGEFGFGYFDYDFMDGNSHGTVIGPHGYQHSRGPLRPLIAPCSYADSFIDAAMQAAQQHRITQTQFVMLLYDFRYDPKVTGITRGTYLRFLGAFPYSRGE